MLFPELNHTVWSPLRYPGGKSLARKQIVPHLLKHQSDCYVSPFMGGGSVELMLCAQGKTVYASDLFEPLVNFWRQILIDPETLGNRVETFYPMTHERFLKLRDGYDDIKTDMDKAVAFLVLNRTSFSGLTFNSTFAPKTQSRTNGNFLPSIFERLRKFKSPNLHVDVLDYKRALDLHKDLPAYLDPPYPVSRNTLYGRNGNMHKHFNHEELAEMLHKRDKWVLSYNDCELIRELYKDCSILECVFPYYMTTQMKHNTKEGQTARRGHELLIFPS